MNLYREPATGNVSTQMKYACEILHEWKKFKPIIAGGALWSWAANRPARDVDIFAKDSWRSRRKASKYIHDPSACPLKQKVQVYGYFLYEKAKPIKVDAYRGLLPDGTPLDIVLVPKSGINALRFFDYAHCMVGFGLDEVNLSGVQFYVAGNLYSRHNAPRLERVIMSKVQKFLWGSDEAETAMVKVVSELNNICQRNKL